MKNKQTVIIGRLALLITLITLSACGPVHRFTRVKKVPREYIANYCVDETKVPRANALFRKAPWIVFADNPGQMTYLSATGKNEMQPVDYMDPFLVIGRKGDWLKIIRYNPDILQNGRLKEWKQAQYCGWIHKKDVLLTQNSVTDLQTGMKNKEIILPADTLPLVDAARYFAQDSIRLFRDEDLSREHARLPLYSIVYPMKKSAGARSTLIARKEYVTADSIQTDILGWVPNSLLSAIGQQLHIDTRTLPDSTLWFKDRYRQDTLRISHAQWQESRSLAQANQPLSYSPVLSYHHTDTTLCFRTHVPMPVVDRRDSYVLNVNGNPIYYSQFRELEKSLQKVNLVFVMEGQEETLKQFPALVNVIQGLQPVLANDQHFALRFGAVLTFAGKQTPETICPLTPDYMTLLDFLSTRSKQAGELRPTYGLRGSWSGLRDAVDMFDRCPDETNLLVVIGDKGFNSEWADSTLVNQMVRNNCRVLGYQLYGGEPDNFNNFVLQVGNMIDNYAPKISRNKREMIVYADQLCNGNEYRETKTKNIYCLDFPQRSMTQGWLVFPQKNETLELETLAAAVDSMLVQVKDDNRLLITSLQQAFDEIGYFRYKTDSTLMHYHNHYQLEVQPLVSRLKNTQAGWKLPAQPLVLPDSLSPSLHYHLLLTEKEFKNLRAVIHTLSGLVVDYKFQSDKKKQKKRKICDCPDDYLPEPAAADYSSPADSLYQPEYASTWKTRRLLIAYYRKYGNRNKYCRLKRKELMDMPLADIHERITLCPTENPFLKAFRLRDLKKKEIFPDETLDELLDYFKTQRKELDAVANNYFLSNGQVYYWVDRKVLP